MEGDALPQPPDTQLYSGCFSLQELRLCREGEAGGGGLQAEASTSSGQKTDVFANIPCIPAWKGFLGRFFRKSTARVSSPQQYFLMMTEPLFPLPPCYQLANLPAHSDTQLREMKTVLLIDETLDKITWF